MKTYETVREMVDCLVDFHSRAASLAEEGMNCDQDNLVYLMFNFLFDHHMALQDNIGDFEASLDDEGWEPYELSDLEAPDTFVAGLEISEMMSYEEAMAVCRELGEYVIALLDDIFNHAGSADAEEVFDQIIDIEKEEQRLFARSVNALKDL